ncbi:thiosulfate transmembrane transporter [Aureococcus anophagefferens]|uniref:Thiosulfate transmembrane transporter n=1 Tax=Aureococcus anophagefferens TaxID=44056 RepID=A0ABR1G738_AURAN
MAALAASSLPKSASHDDLAALSISKSASDGAMASPGLARAQSFASTPSLASLAGPPAPPLELEERDAASGLNGGAPGPDGGGGGAWRGVARALLDVLGEVAGDRPVLGVGHSFGAVCLLLAPPTLPPPLGLALFEPIVAAAGHDAAAVAGDAQCLAALARARHEKLRARRPPAAAVDALAGWDPATARAFLDRGVRRGAPACAAATEAGARAVVAAGRRSGALRRLAARDDLAKPHAHLRALESLAGALDCPRLRLKLPRTTTRGGLAIATDRGHALPMEDPPWTAAVVLAAADALLPRP